MLTKARERIGSLGRMLLLRLDIRGLMWWALEKILREHRAARGVLGGKQCKSDRSENAVDALRVERVLFGSEICCILVHPRAWMLNGKAEGRTPPGYEAQYTPSMPKKFHCQPRRPSCYTTTQCEHSPPPNALRDRRSLRSRIRSKSKARAYMNPMR